MNEPLGVDVEVEGVRYAGGRRAGGVRRVVTEVPLTIMANDVEVATLMCLPADLKELTYGYLLTSGFIASAAEVTSWACDTGRWTVWVEITRTPDVSLAQKRLYTSGCGKCAMYTTINEASLRRPCVSELVIRAPAVVEAGRWIGRSSTLFGATGGVHAAGLVDAEDGPLFFREDVARHNAVDKVIGSALIESIDMSRLFLVRTGRTSAEILFKVRRAGIALTAARGAPTHQAIALARDMGVTLVGFLRDDEFSVYTHGDRISFGAT